jgi:hypothetical protein
VDGDLKGIVEEIASLEHEQWMAWASTLMERESLSPERVARWKACMVPYAELSEEMKEHDRVWARKVLDVRSALSPAAADGTTLPAIASIEAACSREVARVASSLNDEQRRAIRVALRAVLAVSAPAPQAAAPQAGAGYARQATDEERGEVRADCADGEDHTIACVLLSDLEACESALSSAQARVADVERESARAEREWLQTNLNYQAELDRERAARAEMQRLYEHRGAALLRPCISCGYQPKVTGVAQPRKDGRDL